MIKEPDPSTYIAHSHDSLFKSLMQDKTVALDKFFWKKFEQRFSVGLEKASIRMIRVVC